MYYSMMEITGFLEKLTQEGYQAYWIGGCVRDFLLNRASQDYDVATSATVEEMMDLFSEYELDLQGRAYGGIKVLYQGVWIECTQLRKESGVSAYRYPQQCLFTQSLQEDVHRRDFTINAIAMDVHGQLIDYFQGQQDLKNRLIRVIGDPNLKFKTDALRILRALRFQAQLGFQIEFRTQQAIETNLDLIQYLSPYHFTKEFKKLLLAKEVDIAMTLLIDLFKMQPLKLNWIRPVFEVRLVCLIEHGFPKDKVLLTKKQAQLVDFLITHTWDSSLSKVYDLAYQVGWEWMKYLSEKDQQSERYQQLSRLDKRELAISGKDIQALGINPSETGNYLKELYVKVCLGSVKNTLQDLTLALKEMI